MNWRVSPVAGLHQNQMLAASFFLIFFIFSLKFNLLITFLKCWAEKYCMRGLALKRLL